MTRYIVRSRGVVQRRGKVMEPMRLDAQSRRNVREELQVETQRDRGHDDLVRWTRERVERGDVAPLLGPERATAAGTMLLAMDPEVADQLRTDVPDIEVITDGPLGLVLPVDNLQGSIRATVDPADCWHRHELARSEASLQAATGAGIKVAVLDTGVADHPSLGGRVTQRWELVGGTVVPRPSPGDTADHGTSVASLIASPDVGVAPGAEIVDVLLAPGARLTRGDFLAVLQWIGSPTGATDVDVLNASVGFYGYDDLFEPDLEVLMQGGTLPIFAAGNQTLRSCSPGNLRGMVSVGAVGAIDDVAPFSSRESFRVPPQQWSVPLLLAPGVDLWCAIAAGGFRQRSGTSFAAPLVAGFAARLREALGAVDAFALLGEVIQRCRPITGVNPGWQGHGRLL